MSAIGHGHISARDRVLILISALALLMLATYAAVVPHALAAATVTLEDGVNGCMGVRTTPGSENTTKELIGGTLAPGGTAQFRFTFPADPDGSPGQAEWKLTDCVFIDLDPNDDKDGDPFQKYEVTALENNVSPVIIEFTLTIPADVPVGAEFCDYAKTTETPSNSQGSNRKAGPACFIVGGTPPTPTPTPTATQSVKGSTATPTPTPTTEESVQGGTGTPAPSQPDTAAPFGIDQGPIPAVILALLLLLGLSALAAANVRSSQSRR